MSMLRFNQWLDEVDPYTIQRMALSKALCIATIMMYAYWIFLPVNFMAFILPFFVASLYELPIVSTFKKKEELLLFICGTVILISVSFYLLYPFKGIFFFFSLWVFTLLYFVVLKYFYALKSLVMMILSTGTIILATEPEGVLQIAYGFISSMLITSITLILCLRIIPNQYLRVWNRALQHFIQCLEQSIGNALLRMNDRFTKEEVLHFEMVRNYQRLVGQKYMLMTFRMAVYLRNIQLSLDNIYYEPKNEFFWLTIQKNLLALRMNMSTYTPCAFFLEQFNPETKLQIYVKKCLKQTIKQWNNLCTIQSS